MARTLAAIRARAAADEPLRLRRSYRGQAVTRRELAREQAVLCQAGAGQPARRRVAAGQAAPRQVAPEYTLIRRPPVALAPYRRVEEEANRPMP